ncbi:MAG: carboxypeptidase-like regulatory domain-containing protein, partial [bacterium]|nr:carboxypeptidase-like regulatory domain-containing protein [bacterium]
NHGSCLETHNPGSSAFDEAGINFYDFDVDISINNQAGKGSPSPRNSTIYEIPVGGTNFKEPEDVYPHLSVSAEDVLFVTTTIYGRYRVIVGTHAPFSIFVATSIMSNSKQVLYQSTSITPIDQTTRRLDFIVSTPTTKGFIQGYVVKPPGSLPQDGLNNIPVRATNSNETTSTVYTGGAFGSNGYFRISIEASNDTYLEVNMSGVTNPNYISLSTGPFDLKPGEVKSFISPTDRIFLTQKGSAYGFVGVNALDPLPGYVVLATSTGRSESTITDSSGVFRFTNLTTGTWHFTVLAEAAEKVTAIPGAGDTHTRNISIGANVWVGSFTITGAFSKFIGVCRYNNRIIDSGVLILASTSPISAPPEINQSLVKGSRVYYSTISKGDGSYELLVRGGQSYYLYAYYTYFTGANPTTINKNYGPITINQGRSTTLNIDFP